MRCLLSAPRGEHRRCRHRRNHHRYQHHTISIIITITDIITEIIITITVQNGVQIQEFLRNIFIYKAFSIYFPL
jgi:hypothetical protein